MFRKSEFLSQLMRAAVLIYEKIAGMKGLRDSQTRCKLAVSYTKALDLYFQDVEHPDLPGWDNPVVAAVFRLSIKDPVKWSALSIRDLQTIEYAWEYYQGRAEKAEIERQLQSQIEVSENEGGATAK